MNHDDHVGLIRAGLEGAGPRWLELGAGEGAFTLALADILGPGGRILATDRDGRRPASRGRVWSDIDSRQTQLEIRDSTSRMVPAGPFDGVLAANTPALRRRPRSRRCGAIRFSIRPGGRLVVVEYDADRGNPWVPHPFSFETLANGGGAGGLRGAATPGPCPEPVPGSHLCGASARRLAVPDG